MQLKISEIFGPTIQGEGPLIGLPTVFVRVGGCDYRCTWCDTLYAVLPEHKDEWTSMSPEEVVAKVQDISPTPILVTLSGGNPALYVALGDVVRILRGKGYPVACETQGSKSQAWFKNLSTLVLSPKPPSSGMDTDWLNLAEAFLSGPDDTVFKVVVGDDTDLAYAKQIRSMYPGAPMYLQPLNEDVGGGWNTSWNKYRWLAETVKNDLGLRDVRVLPQLHVLLWGGNKRGV